MSKGKKYTEKEDLKILFFDDDSLFTDIFKIMYSQFYKTVTCCNKYEDLIQQLSKEKYDILIVDFFLNDLTGDEVCKNVRELLGDDIYIISLTDLNESYKVNMEGFIDAKLFDNYAEKDCYFKDINKAMVVASASLKKMKSICINKFKEFEKEKNYEQYYKTHELQLLQHL